MRVEQTYYCFRIYINDLLHFHMEGRPEQVEVWYDDPKDHTIRLTGASGNRVRLRYDKRSLWLQIIDKVDKALRR